MSQKFSGFLPRAVSSSISIIDSPAPVVTRPISPCGIELDVVETLAQLAVGVDIGFGPRFDQRGDARLAFHRVQVHHHLGVAGDAAERRRRTAD